MIQSEDEVRNSEEARRRFAVLLDFIVSHVSFLLPTLVG